MKDKINLDFTVYSSGNKKSPETFDSRGFLFIPFRSDSCESFHGSGGDIFSSNVCLLQIEEKRLELLRAVICHSFVRHGELSVRTDHKSSRDSGTVIHLG